MNSTRFFLMFILIMIIQVLDFTSTLSGKKGHELLYEQRLSKSSAIHLIKDNIIKTCPINLIQPVFYQPKDARAAHSQTKTAHNSNSRSINCGQFRIKWFYYQQIKDSPLNGVLIVETKNDSTILEVSEEVFPNQKIQFLWCKDLLGEGTPVISYTVYTGGAHCCWNGNVVMLSQPPRWLLQVSLSWGDLLAEQLDNTDPLELITKTRVFDMINELPSYTQPFLPLIFLYNGKYYVEATCRFPKFIRADLEKVQKSLCGQTFEERAGKALGAFGNYILLGEADEGLKKIKRMVSPDVAVWLEKHEAEAIECVKHRYGLNSHFK